MNKNDYKDGIRSSCHFQIDWWARILLLIRGKFTVTVRVDTENICGQVSDAQFNLTIEPLIKRKQTNGFAEIVTPKTEDSISVPKIEELNLTKCQCGHSKDDHSTNNGQTICQVCTCLASHRFAEKEPLEAEILIWAD